MPDDNRDHRLGRIDTGGRTPEPRRPPAPRYGELNAGAGVGLP